MSIKLPSQLMSDRPDRRPGRLLTGAVLIVAAIPRLLSLRAFLAHDETQYWEWSHAFFMALLRGDLAGTIVGPGNPSVTLFWNHSLNMGLKYAWAWLQGMPQEALATWPDFQLDPTLELLVQRRLPLIFFNILAVVVAFRWLYRLYGSRVALFAAALLALDPFYLADSRTSRGEGLLAGLIILAILAYFLYWQAGQRRYLLLSGLLGGLALLTKTSAVSLVIWLGLATPWLALARPGDNRRRQALSAGLTWGLVAAATYWAAWPAMWAAPGQAIGFILSFLSNVGVSGRDNYFFGQVYHDEPLPFYYLVVYLLRVTPLAWLGLLAALLYLGRTYTRRAEPGLATHPPLWTALLLLFALIYGALMTIGVLKRDWYLLPAFPALDVVSAVGLVWLVGLGWRRWSAKIPRSAAWSGSLGLVLLGQAAMAWLGHPYYYTYWNPLVLGGRWAAHAVMVGWDIDLSAGANYLNTRPHPAHLSAATASTRGFEQIFKGQTIRWVPEEPWLRADYLAIRRNHLQLRKVEPYILDYVNHLELEQVVTLNGVRYLWLYKGPRAQYFAGPSALVGQATLLGYDLDRAEATAGESLALKIYWQYDGLAPADDLFWQLVDAGDNVWAEAAARPLPPFKPPFVDEQIVESRVTLPVPVGTPPGTYFLRAGVYSQARQEALGYFTLPPDGSRITIKRPAQFPPAGALVMDHRLGVTLGQDLMLLGFSGLEDPLLLSEENRLSLYWQAQTAIRRDYVIGLQLLDPTGTEVTYWLGRPVMGGYPTPGWVAGEIVRDPWRLSLPAETEPGHYALSLSLFEAATQAQVGQVTLGRVSVARRRQQFTVPEMQHPVDASLGGQVRLLGYDLASEPLTGGGRLRVTLYWQAEQPVPTSYTVFVHLLGPDGRLAAQHDGLPAGGAIPTDQWATDEVITDRHLLEFTGLPPGQYRLVTGMYNPASGERLSTPGGETAIELQTMSFNHGND